MVQLEVPRQKPDGLKHYATDPMKEKVHELLGDMLDRTLLKFRKPQDIKVLHFAGIDAAETQRVYLSRGISPNNIVALERDPEIALKIEELDLGIVVVKSSLRDYVREKILAGQGLNFDVISLDFTGPLSREQTNIMNALFEFNKNNHMLFHSANLLKRDIESFREYRRGITRNTLMEADRASLAGRSATAYDTESSLSRLAAFEENYHEGSGRTELKREHYGNVIFNAMVGAGTDEQWFSMVKFIYGNEIERVLKEISEILYKMGGNDVRNYSGNLFSHPLVNTPQFLIYVDQVVSSRLLEQLKPYGYGKFLTILLCSLGDAFFGTKGFGINTNTNYSYISESGAPMVGSIYSVSRLRYVENATMDLARACGFPDRFHIKDTNAFEKAYNRYVKELLKTSQKTTGPSQDMQFLGNSSKPVLTKGRFLQELDDGISIEEVRQKYRGWQNKPLAQWKAHHTMGTYGKDKAEAEAIIEEPEYPGTERITKDEAYELLQAGIPAREIYDTYPTSFTMGQLSAFRAWLTMREAKRE